MQPHFDMFQKDLPILGKDGTLADTQKDSPGAGHVFAKTGTYGGRDYLNGRRLITGKGLAGYTTTPDGRHLAFAFYVNNVERTDDQDVSDMCGQALGEMASALYALPLGGEVRRRHRRSAGAKSRCSGKYHCFTRTHHARSMTSSLAGCRNERRPAAPDPRPSLVCPVRGGDHPRLSLRHVVQ